MEMPTSPLPSVLQIEKNVQLRDPILIEGLPGIGFVANVAVSHLVRRLGAEKFGEVYSPHFQDGVFSTIGGGIRRPCIEFYASKVQDRDLIFLYGNTQSLTRFGQYELSGRILDLVREMGCKEVVCFAGLRRDYLQESPRVFCTASDFAVLEHALRLGVEPIRGEVYGMAGLLIGLARLKGMQGLCLLAETTGFHPDALAAKAVLERFAELYGLRFDFSDLDEVAENIKRSFESMKL